jgi:tetratricopeptide (TPR) repeat protein
LVNQALQIEPKEALFHGLRGQIRQAQGRDSEALTHFNRALALYPDFYQFHLARGLLYQKRRESSAAQRDLQASLALRPTPEAVFGLGELAQAKGDKSVAIDYFSQVAKSGSALAKPAAKQLALLDLAQNPARFLPTQLSVDAQNYLLVKVRNISQVPVHQVRLSLGEQVGSGVQERSTFRLSQTLSAGAEVVLKTRVSVPDQATLRRLVAKVDQAQILK